MLPQKQSEVKSVQPVVEDSKKENNKIPVLVTRLEDEIEPAKVEAPLRPSDSNVKDKDMKSTEEVQVLKLSSTAEKPKDEKVPPKKEILKLITSNVSTTKAPEVKSEKAPVKEDVKDAAEQPIKPKALKVPPFVREPMNFNAMKEPPKKPETAKVEPAKRLMFKDLKINDWPNAKNVKVIVLVFLETNILCAREAGDQIDAYYQHIETEVAEYAKGKLRVDYQPV